MAAAVTGGIPETHFKLAGITRLLVAEPSSSSTRWIWKGMSDERLESLKGRAISGSGQERYDAIHTLSQEILEVENLPCPFGVSEEGRLPFSVVADELAFQISARKTEILRLTRFALKSFDNGQDCSDFVTCLCEIAVETRKGREGLSQQAYDRRYQYAKKMREESRKLLETTLEEGEQMRAILGGKDDLAKQAKQLRPLIGHWLRNLSEIEYEASESAKNVDAICSRNALTFSQENQSTRTFTQMSSFMVPLSRLLTLHDDLLAIPDKDKLKELVATYTELAELSNPPVDMGRYFTVSPTPESAANKDIGDLAYAPLKKSLTQEQGAFKKMIDQEKPKVSALLLKAQEKVAQTEYGPLAEEVAKTVKEGKWNLSDEEIVALSSLQTRYVEQFERFVTEKNPIFGEVSLGLTLAKNLDIIERAIDKKGFGIGTISHYTTMWQNGAVRE